MGQNQVKLVEGYLALRDELDYATDNEAELIRAKMDGIVFAYETYTEPQYTFNGLLNDYAYYKRR